MSNEHDRLGVSHEAQEARQREAREILERAERDSVNVYSGALQKLGSRMALHFSGRDNEATAPVDAVEVWAKRIGRVLAVVLFALLLVNLFTGWFL